MDLAQRLSAHPLIARVLYPGLPQHPGHDIGARQMEGGFGYMLSIQVIGGQVAAVKSAAHVELYKRATSLGGVESLIEHRASIEGAGSPCPTDLLRLSTGIEDVDDLYADLDQALGDDRDSAGFVNVQRNVFAARFEIDQQRRARAEGLEIIDFQFDAGFAGHREKV